MKEKLKMQLKALLIVAAALILFSGGVSALQIRDSAIRMRVFINGEGPMIVETKQLTVEAFLDEAGIPYSATSEIKPGLDSATEQDLRLEIRNEAAVKFVIDGSAQPLTMYMYPTTITGAVNKLTKATGKTYTYERNTGLNPVTEGTTVYVTSKETRQMVEYSEIAFNTTTLENPELLNTETNVIQEGAAGRNAKITTIELLGGKEVSREDTGWYVETPAQERVIEIGTKAPKPAGPAAWEKEELDVSALAYTKVFDMSATAYTNDFKSCGKRPGDKGFGLTATGIKAQLGVVAVDPRVIPLHTKLYITGYGYAYAGDTGGAVKGNIVDLFFTTPGEVDAYGRHKVQVYVLEDQSTDYFLINR